MKRITVGASQHTPAARRLGGPGPGRGFQFAAAALLLFTVAPAFAQFDLFVSYLNTTSNHDFVGRYNGQTGTAVNATLVQLDSATGVAVGPDQNLYVATTNSFSFGSAVMRYNVNSGANVDGGNAFVSHVSDSAFAIPGGLAFGSNGNLYVAEQSAAATNPQTGRILTYNSAGTRVGSFGSGSPLLDTPSNLVFNASGTLFITDMNQGNVMSLTGSTFATVNSTPGVFINPTGIGLGLDNNLYVLNSQSGSSAIFRLNPITGASTALPTDFIGAGFTPSGLTVGPDGQLYVAGMTDSGNGQILRYATDGSGGTVFVDLGFGASPSYVAFGAIPEPSTWKLAAGLAALAFAAARRCRPRRTQARE